MPSGWSRIGAIVATLGVVGLSFGMLGGLWYVHREQARAAGRAAVEQTLTEAIFAQDRHDGAAFARHFIANGVVRITDSERPLTARGNAALRGFASGPPAGNQLPFSTGPGDSHHIMTNNVVVLRDHDHALHRAYYVAVARNRAQNGLVFVQMGSFEDRLVRRGGQWLIEEHHIRHRAVVDDMMR